MAMKNSALWLFACFWLSLALAAPLDPTQYSATSLTWRHSVARVLYTASSEYKLNDLLMTKEDEEKWWACVFQSRRASGIVEICAGPSVMGHSRYVGKQEELRRFDPRFPGLHDRVLLLRSQLSPLESLFMAGCLGLGFAALLRVVLTLCLTVWKSINRPESSGVHRTHAKKRGGIRTKAEYSY